MHSSRIVIFLCALFCTLGLYGQSPIPLSFKGFRCYGAHESDCRSIKRIVSETLRTDKRFILQQTAESLAVQTEQGIQKQEDFLEGEVVETTGTEELPDQPIWRLGGNYRHRTGIITFQLFQEGTNIPIGTQQLRLETGILKTAEGQQDLILVGLRRLLAQQFSITVPLVKRLEGSEKKVKTVLVAGGTDQGFYVNQNLTVHAKNSPDEVLGKLEVIEVEGERFSQCQVVKGSKEIAIALQAGTSLIVKE